MPTMSPRMVSSRIDMIRAHLSSLAAAVPLLPQELERVWIIVSLEFRDTGLIRIALLIAFFVLLGFGAEWLYRRALRPAQDWLGRQQLDTVGNRVRAAAARLAYGVGQVTAFALGSIGAFLPFHWPPLLRDIVLGYLLAFLALRLATAVTAFLLAPPDGMAPQPERFRIILVTDVAARFWLRRMGLLVGWFAFGYVTVTLLGIFGLLVEGRRLVAYILGLGLLAIGIEMMWRRPRPSTASTRPARDVVAIAASAYLVLLWGLWVAGTMPAFWLLVLAVAVPLIIRATRRAIEYLVGSTGPEGAGNGARSLYAVSLERGLRAGILVGAALLLAHLWSVDLIALTASDTLTTRLLRGALSAVVIVLIADFLWRLAKAMIDRKIAEAQSPSQADSEEARRRARLRTLLPILRNLLSIVFLVMVAMMVLSALGIEIGPLIAGAGVIGVAIGFGAQTLVKDIISGMFYLLDDAFRVGEYIQSGNYKGTVESFSLRSVKLRHHRGPLYTVPFGELGAVQNMSRDWVIDKLTVGVTYDTNLEKARKLIKQIGKELAADPEFAPNLLETLKMQGVEQFGDFAIQIRMKMMTRPGEQFVIRRRAYAMIKKAFDDNGIRFALPTVQVSEGGDTAAAARQALDIVKPPVADAAS
ncbi:MAG: mechanosensitive ion channel family protein [Rhodospirillales bacterium]|nr:mechanosensitive ion channel family protein [Rhodospirillales bacterium]